jgi:hypothetical protein
VDQIASSPTTRLDLNDGTTWNLVEKDMSPPPLRRIAISTMMRDGEEIPATAFENRVVKLVLDVQASSKDNLATELQKLDRELDRRNNILKWQPQGSTKPVFFRTLRSPDYKQAVALEVQSWYRMALSIVAEPFAYGLFETSLNAVTINNDPAHASRPQYDDTLSTILGDVPTPAYITTTAPVGTYPQLIAVRRHGTPGVIFAQAESLTNGTDAADVADANASAGNAVDVTPGTTTMATRLTWASFPRATPTADDRGVYRVFARVKKATAGDTWKMRIQHTFGGVTATGPTVTLTAALANYHLIDLGLVQLPGGQDPVFDGYSNVQWAFEDSTLILQAERSGGSGAVRIDYIKLVPADEELAMAKYSGTAATMLWDGPMDVVRNPNGATTLAAFERAGAIPMLSPNQVNRIHVLKQVGITDAITDTTTLTVGYWPRWLNVARPA